MTNLVISMHSLFVPYILLSALFAVAFLDPTTFSLAQQYI